MKPQKISSLEQRNKDWKKKRASWLKTTVPVTMLIGMIISCAMLYLFQKVPVYLPELNEVWIESGLGSLERLYLVYGVVLGGFLSIPILYINYPVKPSLSDVNADILLRKAFKMDASVSDK